MSRAINIGELLQSGLLGGAQLYNQQASRRQQGEIANRELDQREAIRNDRLVETEFQRQQQLAEAQRLLDQEAADGAIFGAIRSLGQPVMGPQQPGAAAPDPFAGIDGMTVGRASPRAQDAYARFALSREGAMQTRQRLIGKYNYLKAADLNQHLTQDDFWEMVDNGIEFEEDQIPYQVREQMDAGQASIRDAYLTSLGTVMRPEELNPYAAMQPRVFNSRFAQPLQAEAKARREAAAKAAAEQMTPEMLAAAVQNQMVLNPTWSPQQAAAFVMEREAGRVNQTDANIGSRGPDQTKALMEQMKVLDAVIAPYLDTYLGGLKENAPAKAKAAMRLREQIESRLMQSMGQPGADTGGGMGGGAGVVAPESTIVVGGKPMSIQSVGGVEADRARVGRAKSEFAQIHGREADTKNPADVNLLREIRDRLLAEETQPR